MRLLRFFLSAFFLFSFCVPSMAVSSDTQHWEFAGWYGGGCFPDLQFDPHVPNRVYLTSDVAGIWRSDDLGENWRFINRGLRNLNVPLLAIAPSDPNVLYAGTKGGVFVSKDAGQSWLPCDDLKGKISFRRPENHASIAVSFSNPAILVIGTSKGFVFYSEDQGAHWRSLGGVEKPFFSDDPITAIQWTLDGAHLYFSSAKGLVKFSFEGEKWKSLPGSPTDISDLYISKRSSDILFAAGGPALWISEDGGKTWKEGKDVPRGSSYRVILSEEKETPAGASKMAVAWNDGWKGGVAFSGDFGKSWIDQDQKMFPDAVLNPTRAWAGPQSRINAVRIDPFNDKVLFRTDWWGVWRSDDGGANWQEKIKGTANTVGSDIAVSSSGDVYATSMDDGLLKSSNGGQTYQAVYPSKSYDPEINGHVWRVRELTEEKILMTASPWYGSLTQIALIDAKTGQFKVVREGLPSQRPKKETMWGEGYPRALAVDPSDPRKVYLGIDGDDGGGLYVSSDGGEHWNCSKGQPSYRKIYNALAVDPTSPNRIFWGTYSQSIEEGGVYVSEDQGSSWKRIFVGVRKVFNLTVAPDGTVYVCGDRSGPCVFVSKDHGRHWKLIGHFGKEGSATAVILIPQHPEVLMVGTTLWHDQTGGSVYLSADGGASWKDMLGDLPEGAGITAMAYDPKSSFLYITRQAGSVYKTRLNI